jgi:acyl carrier protein
MNLTQISKEKILGILYSAIDELNETLAEGRQLEKSPDTPLFGRGSKLDSVELVSLVMLAEQQVLEETDRIVTLVDERAMSQSKSPFLTVETLADYIVALIEEPADA